MHASHFWPSESQQLLNILYRFGDGKGVNYVEFLEQLQPTETLEDKYQTRMAQLSTRRTMVCIYKQFSWYKDTTKTLYYLNHAS